MEIRQAKSSYINHWQKAKPNNNKYSSNTWSTETLLASQKLAVVQQELSQEARWEQKKEQSGCFATSVSEDKLWEVLCQSSV